MRWQQYHMLYQWLRLNFPILLTPQGNEVLVWLLKNQNRPMPLKNLYGSSHISEPTLRAVIKSFSAMGYVEMSSAESDSRTRYVKITLKLEHKIREFQLMLLDCLAPAEFDGSSVRTLDSVADLDIKLDGRESPT